MNRCIRNLKNRAFNVSIVAKLTVVATVSTIFAVSMASYTSYTSSRELLLENAVEAMGDTMDRQIERAIDALDQVSDDAIFISQSDAVRGIIRARQNNGFDEIENLTEDQWRARLSSVFSVLIESKGYTQVRLIAFEDSGIEMVRVDGPKIQGGEIIIRNPEEMQHKGESEYLIESKKLASGQVHVSNITLNREHGVIETPWRPMQRFSTPVYISDGSSSVDSQADIEMKLTAVELVGKIRHYDEILTMSALAYSQSQDSQWKARYNKHVPLLDEAILQAMSISGKRGLEAIETTNFANQALIEMEERSIDLVHHGKQSEAVSLLRSEEYRSQKEIYMAGLSSFLEALERETFTAFGVIVINYDAKNFIHDGIIRSSAYDMVLTNDSGGVLHHKDLEREWGFEFNTESGWGDQYPETWETLQSTARSVVWDSKHGEIHVVGKIPLEDDPNGRFLGIAMIAHQNDVLAHISGLRTKIMLIAFAAIFATSLLCAFGVHHLTHPIAVLTQQARRISSGDQDAVMMTIGQGEVGLLAAAFSDLIEQLQWRTMEATNNAQEVRELADSLDKKVQDRTEALAESEARTTAILDSAADAIITIDSDGMIQNFNPGAEQIFGVSSMNIIGFPLVSLMPNPLIDGCEAGLADLIKNDLEKIVNHTIETEGLRRDGNQFPLEVAFSVMQTADSMLFTAIGRDITDRKKDEENLKEAIETAEAATKSKSEFLANMSHEIRTPMTAILGYADMLKEMNELTGMHDEQLSAIDTIRRNGEHLLQIINDILDISKIEADKMEFEQICCSPAQIVSDVHSLMQIRADAKNIPFMIEYVGPIPETIVSDPTRLKQILVNIVGNAIKFTESGGVRLITRFVKDENDPVIQFDVLDSGIGMTEEQVGKLFQAFAQADTSTTRKFGGTGLGLMISKRFAEMLGGTISVESSPGKGSMFRVSISTGSLYGIDMITNPLNTQVNKPVARALEPKQDVTEICCTILLAEDGVDNQRLISHVLKKSGATVTVVENGKLAYDAAIDSYAAGNPFDIILMDMQMPVLDGYDATSMLREAGYSEPIIALTAHAMASDRQKCLNAGCDDFATKPINRKVLLETIHKYLKTDHPVA